MLIEIVGAPTRLASVVESWRHLLDRTPHATPFHTPEWLLTWWHHFGSGQLQCLLDWQGPDLTGLLPLFCLEWAGQQQLTLVGSGISDYLEPLVPAEDCLRLATAVQNLPSWTAANWQDLDAGSPWLSSDLWPGLSTSVEPDTPCSRIPISGDFTSYWSARGKDLRRNLRRYRDRAEQTASLEFAVIVNDDPSLLQSLIELHAARWQQRGESGTIDANRAIRFLEALTPAMSQCGLLRFFTLRWSGQIVAISLGFAWRNEIFSYLSAFHPEHEALGFGRVLLHESLRWAWSNGFRSWRFLRGEEPYKQSWGATPEAKARLKLART